MKAKIAIEVIREENPVAEIAVPYELHLTMIPNWKRQLLKGASDIFKQQHQGLVLAMMLLANSLLNGERLILPLSM